MGKIRNIMNKINFDIISSFNFLSSGGLDFNTKFITNKDWKPQLRIVQDYCTASVTLIEWFHVANQFFLNTKKMSSHLTLNKIKIQKNNRKNNTYIKKLKKLYKIKTQNIYFLNLQEYDFENL